MRFSNRNVNCYVISYVSSSKKIIHLTINHVNECFEYSGDLYPSICELVQKLNSKLTLPVVGSKFAWIFLKSEDIADIGGYDN